MTQQISQLIPRISPEIDGVGDFALLLAKELRSSYQVETVFFVTQSNGPDISEKDGFKVVSFSKDSPEKFIYSLPEAPLLIHYVGYGFDKNGAPTWIPRALDSINEPKITCPVSVLFHEFYASGPIWTKAFWMRALQRQIVTDLVEYSSSVVVTRAHAVDELKDLGISALGQIRALPTFSTIGEPINLETFDSRKRQLVVFGSNSTRERLYRWAKPGLSKFVQDYEIAKIIDVGPPLSPSLFSSLNDCPIEKLGICTPTEIGLLLCESMFGAIYYPIHLLAKSSIFAAYSSHGVVPIVFDPNAKNTPHDDLAHNIHFLSAQKIIPEISISEISQISSSVTAWYKMHDLKTWADLIYRTCSETINSETQIGL